MTDRPALAACDASAALPIRVRPLRRLDYSPALQAMRDFTAARGADTDDEIWLVEHPPVYTQGQAGRPEHLLDVGAIPVVRTERGGQVTYHGPGQVVAYTLIDLHRRSLLVRDMVCRLEAAVIDCLAAYGVTGLRKPGAPGIYVADTTAAGVPGAKIAALGLKISRGRSYHGVSLNVDMDLAPFGRINPCGFPGLAVTDLRTETRAAAGAAAATAAAALSVEQVGKQLAHDLTRHLSQAPAAGASTARKIKLA